MASKPSSIHEMSCRYTICITNGSLLNTPLIPLSRGNMLHPHFSQRHEQICFYSITRSERTCLSTRIVPEICSPSDQQPLRVSMQTHPENCSRGAGRWGSVRTRCPVSSLLYSPHHGIGCEAGTLGTGGTLVCTGSSASC